MSINKTDIFEADDRPVVAVDVPEWGEGKKVYVQSMSLAEYQTMQVLIDEHGDNPAKIVVRVLCDGEGNRIFDDDDADKLAKKSLVVLNRIVQQFLKVNELLPGDVEAAGKD